ncbi:hypothetical protein Tco_0696325 [Tanacetum coccineum]
MGVENHIRTLVTTPNFSHEGYREITFELPAGNNCGTSSIRHHPVGCKTGNAHSRTSVPRGPNQHLKDFLKLVDSLDLDGENMERTRLRLFQFSLRDQASNWLERLPELIHQHGGSYDQDLALYDNESWNDPKDFAKPVKAIALPQDVPSTSDCRLIKLENQVQRLMEAYLAPTQTIQVNKVSSSCETCSGPHNTQYCMKNPEQAFLDYASSCTNENGGKRGVGERSAMKGGSTRVGMVKGNEGVDGQCKEVMVETDMEVDKVIEEEESEFETDEEVEEIIKEEEDDEDDKNFNLFLTMEELTHNEWLLRPRPPWVRQALSTEASENNIIISAMVA